MNLYMQTKLNSRMIACMLCLGFICLQACDPCKNDPCGPDCMPHPDCVGDTTAGQTFAEVIASGGNMPMVIDQVDTASTSPSDSLIGGSSWKCKTVTYSIVDGLETTPLYNPNAEIIYPGSLLDGSTLNQASPDVIVVGRGGGTISYDLLNGNTEPYFEVDEIALSKVRAAMSNIIANSPDALPANFSFSFEEVQSQKELAFNMGVSVSNLAASVGTNFSFSTDRNYSRYLVKVHQSFFTMNFDLPTSYEDLFAPDVSPEDLARYIGPGHPATYISSVTYGRLFYMLIESTESSQEMEAAINGSFSNVVNQIEADVEVSRLEALSNLKVKVIAFGGESSATFDLIGETNLQTLVSKLGQSSGIDNGLPLSYTVRNAYDNQIVSVKLATEYDVTTCEPAESGLLTFFPQTSLNPSISAPYSRLFGDVNGDGLSDVILNHRLGSNNEIQVGLGDGNGNFALQVVQSHPETSLPWGTWTNYRVASGDVNNDGNLDLVWNNQFDHTIGKNNNVTYIALGQSSGTFDLSTSVIEFPGSWASNYHFQVADVNGDQMDDIVWNELVDARNRSYTCLSSGNSFGDLNGPFDSSVSGWGPYQSFVGDVNGDGREDLFWEHKGGVGTQAVRVGTGNADGSLSPNNPAFVFDNAHFENYDFVVGDITGDGKDDIAMTKWEKVDQQYAIWMGFSGGNRIAGKKLQYAGIESETRMLTLLEDLNKDGRSDLIWNDRTDSKNVIHLGLATAGQEFSFATAAQEHPDRLDWTTYEAPVLTDIDGDSKPDIVWLKKGSPMKIAIARTN